MELLITTNVPIWNPQEGPQTDAYYSKADIVGYGGAAGGGKTDLEIGLALTQHKRSIIYRHDGTQLQGIYDRMEEIIGDRDGFSEQIKKWRHNGNLIEFGGVCAKPLDYKKYQGRPHDLKCFDEVTEMPEYVVRFLMGWQRSSDPDQRCRVLMAFNPPTTSDGRWVIDFFGPWLNKKHINPAKPGELRYYTTIDGKDQELPNGDLVEVDGEMVQPLSRTFIPAKVEDNVYYMESGYKSTLQALPEPLRSQMLKGDFSAGMEESPWQVIPTKWVEAAMERWEPLTHKVPMDSMGVDVARGGRDFTVISKRHGNWFDKLVKYPGTETPDGPITAGLVINERRDKAPVHIDVIGWGSSPYDFLKENGVHVIPINSAEGAKDKKGNPLLSKEGEMKFINVRAWLWWRMREALDPANGELISLPNDDDLLIQLTCLTWSFTKQGIKVESKEDVYDRIQRSTDDADAIIYANVDTPKSVKSRQAINYPDRGTV